MTGCGPRGTPRLLALVAGGALFAGVAAEFEAGALSPAAGTQADLALGIAGFTSMEPQWTVPDAGTVPLALADSGFGEAASSALEPYVSIAAKTGGAVTGSTVSGGVVNDSDRDPKLDFGFVVAIAPETTVPGTPPPTVSATSLSPAIGQLPTTGSNARMPLVIAAGVMLLGGLALAGNIRLR